MNSTVNKKKIIISVAVAATAILAVLVFALFNNGNSKKYKRIILDPYCLGEKTLNDSTYFGTKIENDVSQTFPDTFPVYKITERIITNDEYEILRKAAGIKVNNGPYGNNATEPYGKNEASIRLSWASSQSYKMSDEELDRQAKEVFEKITFLDGEYEYLGITSTRTVHVSEDKSYIDSVRVSFRRIVDNYRVIGDDICDLYFNGNGLCEVEIRLYNYEKIDELKLVSVKNAVGSIKNADSFSITGYLSEGFFDRISTLKAENAKLLFVNQFSSEDCEILQPVYNITGTASAKGEEYEFSAKVVAIPSRYTYIGETNNVWDPPT